MRRRAPVPTFLGPVALALAVLWPPSGAAAPRSTDFERFWRDLQAAASQGDWEGVRELIGRNVLNAERSFWRACDHYVILELRPDAERAREMRECMEHIAGAYLEKFGDGDFNRYAAFLVALDPSDKRVWSDAFGSYYEFVQAYWKAAAPGKPIPALVRAALELHVEPLRAFERLGDRYIQGMIHTCVGILRAKIQDLDGAQRSFARAHKCFSAIGSGHQRKLTEGRLAGVEGMRGLKWRGPDAPPWEVVALEHVTDTTGLSGGVAPPSADDPMLWHRITVPDDRPAHFQETLRNDPDSWAAYRERQFERSSLRESRLYPNLLALDEGRLYLDADGDGIADRAERLDVARRPRAIDLRDLRAPGGVPFRYAVELVDVLQGTWFGVPLARFPRGAERVIGFRRACHREGSFHGRKLLLVDDDSNGSYADIGDDALYLEGEPPQLLGAMNRIGGAIYDVRAAPSGREIGLRPWAGPTGRIRVVWSGKSPPEALHVRGVDEKNRDGLFSLEAGGEVEVPAGTYVLYFGRIRTGGGRGGGHRLRSVQIRMGKAAPIVVEPDATAELGLGAPFSVAWRAEDKGTRIVVPGRDIRIHGRAGELYTRFYDQVPAGEIVLRRKGGGGGAGGQVTERVRPVGFDDRLYDPSAVWYPKDLEVRKDRLGVVGRGGAGGAGAGLEARFRLESELLGRIRTTFRPPSE